MPSSAGCCVVVVVVGARAPLSSKKTRSKKKNGQKKRKSNIHTPPPKHHFALYTSPTYWNQLHTDPHSGSAQQQKTRTTAVQQSLYDHERYGGLVERQWQPGGLSAGWCLGLRASVRAARFCTQVKHVCFLSGVLNRAVVRLFFVFSLAGTPTITDTDVCR